MEFTNAVVRAAWDRQGGRCAKCGRWLVWAQRGRDSATGAWEPHNMNRAGHEGSSGLADCVVLCAGIADCHFNEGHGGIDWSHHACLNDSTLLFLCAGEEMAKMVPESPTSRKGSLIGAVFGVSQVAEGKRRPARKLKSKRNPEEGAKATKAKGKGSGLETATRG